MRNQLGIDIGSANLTVSAANEGIILKEPSLVAKSRADGRFLACGTEAKKLAEKGACSIIRPFRESLCSKHLTVQTISYLLDRAECDKEKNRVLIASPCGESEAKEAALIELAAQAGIGECYLVYSTVAAVIGEGMDFDRAKCVLEIGASRSNMLVVGNGTILYRDTIRAAGDSFDHAIMTYLEQHYEMKINPYAAEQIKRHIGSVWTGTERNSVEVTGRHMRTGEIIRKRIWSDELLIVFESPMTELLETVCRALHKLPAEFIRDVLEDGIYICGGGSLLKGLPQMIREITHVKVVQFRHIDSAVARGLEKILHRLPKEMPLSVGNISRNCIRMHTTAKHT